MASEGNLIYVGGQWKNTAGAAVIESPWDGKPVGKCGQADAGDADEAVKRALLGFDRTRHLSSSERYDILSFIRSTINDQKDEFAQLMTAEIGKPIQFSRVEVDRAILSLQI